MRPRRYYDFGEDRRYLIALAVIVGSYTLEGLIRWLFNMVGLGVVVYSRDLAGVAACGAVLASWITGQASAFPFVVIFSLLLVHFTIGALQLDTVYQAALGLKTFLPFLNGVIVAPLLASKPKALFWASCAMFWTTVFGVLLNSYVDLPWIGLTYETALGQASAALRWTAGDADRLPGFSRASYSASIILLVSCVPLLGSRMQLWRKAVVFVSAVGAIYLTTTKGAFTGAFAMLVVMTLAVLDPLTRIVSNAILVLLWGTCLLTPLVAVELGVWNEKEPPLLGSLRERVADMWPNAFKLLKGPEQSIWGRGLGGLGTGQEASGDWLHVNAADNFFVYILVAFGCLGVVYCLYALLRILRYLESRPADDLLVQSVRGWATIWFAYGVTTNMVEDATMNTAIGIIIGLVFMPPPRFVRPPVQTQSASS